MLSFGAACLILALPVALYGAGAALFGARAGGRRFVESSRRAVYGFALLVTLAVVVVEAAFLRSDFHLQVVADHSSTTTPSFYKFTAMWSSQAGSLLLWAFVLGLFSSAVLYSTRRKHPELVPYATAVLMGLGAFFVALMLFRASPFTRMNPVPAEGVGLNPLLRHPSMIIHPPMLYSGYVGFSIPFAFAIGALASRRVDSAWIRSTRRYTLIAWSFLSLGILLGARWSYSELGWGGYWAWDPVENASLMPWLIGTAFLHSIMVQEKRGMFRVWNVCLIIATFSLALLGTFLVRSGVLQSIHAFGASTVGTPLLILIAVVLIGSTVLIVSRLDDLRSERRVDSLLSRESVFLVNNLLLVGLCVVIFWGTFFPLISEALTGEKSSLAAPWFDQYTTPLALLLVLFSGIGPLVAWRRWSWSTAKRSLVWPLAVAGSVAVLCLLFTDAGHKPLALALFIFAGFTIAVVVQEFVKGVRIRRSLSGESIPGALASMVVRNRRRYGGFIVHIGVSVLLIGVAASSTFQTKRDIRLAPGQTARVDGYDIRYARPTADITNERIAFGAVLDVRRDGKRFAVLHPSRNYYRSSEPSKSVLGQFFEGEATSEVGLRAGVRNDFWTAMQPDVSRLQQIVRTRRFASLGVAEQAIALEALYVRQPPPTTFRVLVSPLVSWLWIGAVIALTGGLTALWPSAEAKRRRLSSLAAARVGRDLSQAET